MILTDVSINPELLIKLVVTKLVMWAVRAERKVPGDQWGGMASCKAHKNCSEWWGTKGALTNCVQENRLN